MVSGIMSSSSFRGRPDAGWIELQHTADAGLEVWAPTLDELLCQAARGMFSLVADSAGVRKQIVRRVEAAGKDAEEMFVNWLSELNFLHQIHGELYVETLVDEVRGAKVSGRVVGERIDPSRHVLRGEIKGVTYHGLEVRRGPGGWRARVLFDV